MPDLTELLDDRCTIAVSLDRGTLHVTYQPSAYTPALEASVAELFADERRPSAPVVALLSALVVDWDLTRQGKPVPIRPDALRQLPTRLLSRILQAIVRDHTAGEAGGNSGAGS